MKVTGTLENVQIAWHRAQFSELSASTLYAILAARVAVFVIEQNCPYQELDGLDQVSHHLWASAEPHGILAYARITAPGSRFVDPSIGRVITTAPARGTGLGRELMVGAIDHCEQLHPGQPIRISAQQHLQAFYASLGFEFVRGPYLEDDIPHIEMLRSEQREG